jgi:hypothetical protein
MREMNGDAREIAKKLARIQNRLRRELLDELKEHEEDVETIFDPYSYSPIAQELRDKYLNRLYVLQALIQEMAHFNQGRRQPPVKVLSLRGNSSEELVEIVNRKLADLNGAKVMDVEFLQNKQDDYWVALITYVANPFVETQGEAAAFM